MSVIEFKTVGVEQRKLDILASLPSILHMRTEQQDYITSIRLHTDEPQLVVPTIYKTMDETQITDLSITKPTLEDAYVKIVGGKAL